MARFLTTLPPDIFCAMLHTLVNVTQNPLEIAEFVKKQIDVVDYKGNQGLDALEAELIALQGDTDPVAMASLAAHNPMSACDIHFMRGYQKKNPKNGS